jgi:hypothetical protein
VAEFTRPATWEDVKRLARYLEEAGVDYALIGGYAPDVFAAQKSYAIRINDEITVDVLPAAAGVPWEAIARALQALGRG